MNPDQTPPPPPTFRQALRFWFRLGWLSFGGPAGQIALMHRELVEERRWVAESRFLHALNYCMLLPGPEAQQLATYLGWLMHRTAGGLAAGLLFVLPGFAVLVGLAWLYMAWGQAPAVAALFWGIKPAVVAIVAQAACRLGTRTLRNGALWAIAVAAFVGLSVFSVPFPAIIAGAALAGALGGRLAPGSFGGTARPAASVAAAPPAVIDSTTPPPAHARFSWRRLLAVAGAGLGLWALVMGGLAAAFGDEHMLVDMGGFFTKAALLTFGGAYAVLPYVWQGAVEHYGWVSPAVMIDGLALGETTPGPLIMVVVFVAFAAGYGQAAFGPEALVAAGLAAAGTTAFFTFLPSFVFILAGGPLVESTRGSLKVAAPLTAVTAAVVGVIANLALFFAAHVFWPQGMASGFDAPAAGLALLAALALLRWRRGTLEVIAGCAAAGWLFQFWVG